MSATDEQLMRAVVSERERVLAETRAPLIELVAAEKVYRMGKLDYHALRGIDRSTGPA